jgi:hypothetical protein
LSFGHSAVPASVEPEIVRYAVNHLAQLVNNFLEAAVELYGLKATPSPVLISRKIIGTPRRGSFANIASASG